MNGTEITVAELNEEARARGLPIGHDSALKAALVQELVDRKLLVEAAREAEFDRQPSYLLARRRSDEIILAQQMLAAAIGTGGVPDGELRKYIAANPAAFEQRALLSVDQLTISAAVPAGLRQALAEAPTTERMQQLASAAGVPTSRTQETVDSANALDPRAQALARLRAGQSFVLQQPGRLVAGKVVSMLPQPVPEEQQLQVARDRLKQQQTQAVLDSMLQELRPGARVQYQPGFEPVAAPPRS